MLHSAVPESSDLNPEMYGVRTHDVVFLPWVFNIAPLRLQLGLKKVQQMV